MDTGHILSLYGKQNIDWLIKVPLEFSMKASRNNKAKVKYDHNLIEYHNIVSLQNCKKALPV